VWKDCEGKERLEGEFFGGLETLNSESNQGRQNVFEPPRRSFPGKDWNVISSMRILTSCILVVPEGCYTGGKQAMRTREAGIRG
jgi:hypothetical protein